MVLNYNKYCTTIYSDKVSMTRQLYFPTVYDRKNCKIIIVPNVVLTQFLSGHGKFGEYLNRFRIRNNGEYAYGK